MKLNFLDAFQSPDTLLFQVDAKNYTVGDIGLDYPYFNAHSCGSSSSYLML